ncbi:MAG TPA: hypothetical protein VFS00_05165, partial [Polyangiaceae bacterium]|nr:hypothetical protein [Polyangiaceae bacterium]
MLRPTLALGAFVTVTALGALGPFGAAAYAQDGGGNNWGAVGGAAAPADQPAAEAKAGASGPEAASGGAAGPKASGGAAGPKAEGKA